MIMKVHLLLRWTIVVADEATRSRDKQSLHDHLTNIPVFTIQCSSVGKYTCSYLAALCGFWNNIAYHKEEGL